MRYVKFNTQEEAETYRSRLQSYHDAKQDPSSPRIVDCVIQTWDGKFALTLQDDDVDCPDVGSGEAVESVERPVIEEPEQ